MLSIPAQNLLDSYDQARSVNREACGPIESLAHARQIQDEIVAARVARGETRVGYKIGFTNRTIWERYGVHHPIWGPIYDTTTDLLSETTARTQLDRFAEPRLEPEIVVRLSATPPEATPVAIANCLEWVAHGFEIVQSHYPGWQFTGAESFAAQGLHGALFVGPRLHPTLLCHNLGDLPAWLANISLTLHLDDQADPVDQGVGSNVLDGPLHAIAHLLTELEKTGRWLAAGDMITTGTITDAQPLVLGQRWHTQLVHADPLQAMQLLVQGESTAG